MKEDKLTIVLVTSANAEEAQSIATKLIEQKLAACVNIIKEIQSLFVWKMNLENCTESLLIIKTKKSLVAELQTQVKILHSYENPEFISLDADSVSSEYLKWVFSETKEAENV